MNIIPHYRPSELPFVYSIRQLPLELLSARQRGRRINVSWLSASVQRSTTQVHTFKKTPAFFTLLPFVETAKSRMCSPTFTPTARVNVGSLKPTKSCACLPLFVKPSKAAHVCPSFQHQLKATKSYLGIKNRLKGTLRIHSTENVLLKYKPNSNTFVSLAASVYLVTCSSAFSSASSIAFICNKNLFIRGI